MRKITHILTSLSVGLVAGLLYAYQCSVNPGLHRLDDTAYLQAMQHINAAIQNPLFFVSFMGSVLLLPLSTWMQWRLDARGRAFWLWLGATATYLIGVIGVTVVGNVPLNEALAGFDIAHASAADLQAQRLKFEGPWNNWHVVRTVASVGSFVLALLAIWERDK